MDFPIRVSEDGTLMEPSGIDPYELPWVQGASATVPTRTKRRYPVQLADLREKLTVLKAKRPAKAEAEYAPAWGPRRRPAELRVLDQQPPSADGETWDH